MPELPEVETYVRELGPRLAGRSIRRAQVFWPRTIARPGGEEFVRRLPGLRFAGHSRRGKYMLLGLEPAGEQAPAQWTLIVHLRMTGKLSLVADDHPPDKHTHVVLDLDEHPSGQNRLIFVDPRKFGRIWLTPEPGQVLAKLGPEPLSDDFSPIGLAQALARRRAAVKSLLLDQHVVAGVGNIYADEALYRAGIHPARPAAALDMTEVERLHAAVCRVLAEGIRRRGSSLGGSALQNYVRPSGEQGGFQEEHRVFRRTGQACYACGALIERMVIGQRSTHYCPVCQPAPA